MEKHEHKHYSSYEQNCLPELLLSNTIHDSTANIIAEIGNGTRDSIHATNLNGVSNLTAIHNGTTANLKAIGDVGISTNETVNRNGLLNLKETGDASRDNLRETSRVGSDLAKDVSDARSATERTSAENRLQMAIVSGEVRELIGSTSTTNLLAIKDNLAAIKEEGCKNQMETIKQGCDTREVVKDKFYDLNTEVLKGFAASQLEALKNKCDLEKEMFKNKADSDAKAAECCCEMKELVLAQANATRELFLSENAKNKDALISKLEMQLLLQSSNSKKD